MRAGLITYWVMRLSDKEGHWGVKVTSVKIYYHDYVSYMHILNRSSPSASVMPATSVYMSSSSSGHSPTSVPPSNTSVNAAVAFPSDRMPLLRPLTIPLPSWSCLWYSDWNHWRVEQHSVGWGSCASKLDPRWLWGMLFAFWCSGIVCWSFLHALKPSAGWVAVLLMFNLMLDVLAFNLMGLMWGVCSPSIGALAITQGGTETLCCSKATLRSMPMVSWLGK